MRFSNLWRVGKVKAHRKKARRISHRGLRKIRNMSKREGEKVWKP